MVNDICCDFISNSPQYSFDRFSIHRNYAFQIIQELALYKIFNTQGEHSMSAF